MCGNSYGSESTLAVVRLCGSQLAVISRLSIYISQRLDLKAVLRPLQSLSAVECGQLPVQPPTTRPYLTISKLDDAC